jgi:hypothetical protein
MFVAKNEEMVLVTKTEFVCTRYLFSEWVTCGNEISRNQPNMSFGMLVEKNEEMVPLA